MRFIFINGIAIASRRKEIGLKGIELAETIGCSPAYISQIEKNNEKISHKTAVKLAAALNFWGISSGTSPYGLYFVAKDIKESGPKVIRGGANK